MPWCSSRSVSSSRRPIGSALGVIRGVEPRVADAIVAELNDQRASLKLIASENYASPAVLLAMGNWFSDKYAEGTIGRRFYAGCKNVDTIESLAAEHARELFGAPHAYAQPHSGIDANLVAFWAVLMQRVERPALDALGQRHINDLDDAQWAKLRADLGNQRLLGMSLDAGGHLTHGFRPNISGKMFDQRSYGTDPDSGLLDYDALREQAREFRPLIIIGGYSAYPRLINFADHARDRRRGRRHADGRHGPLRRAGRGQGADRRLRPDPARPPDHHDHPQVAARAARRPGAVRRRPGRVRGPGLPGGARRPAVAHHGGQGGGPGRGPHPGLPRLRPADRGQRQGAGRRPAAARRHAGHRRHRQPHRAAGCLRRSG